jgi:hypothetical protein
MWQEQTMIAVYSEPMLHAVALHPARDAIVNAVNRRSADSSTDARRLARDAMVNSVNPWSVDSSTRAARGATVI